MQILKGFFSPQIVKTKCITKKFTFAVSNQQKCIANLLSLRMHFRQDFPK